MLDLHMGLTLRNSGSKHIRGVTLLITAQEFAPGGKGSVARPSIDVAPGQNFTLPVDIRLVRPVQQTAGPLVHVQLDGVLFDDLSFFGPNKLNSQRALTFWEVEAQRDRAYFKQALQARGESGLGRGDAERVSRGRPIGPQLDVSLTRNGRAVGAAVPATDHVAQFAFLNLPNAPVQPLEGWAAISGNEARSPQIEIVNNSGKAVRYVEIGWLVKDKQGQEYLAGSVPASESTMLLPSGQQDETAAGYGAEVLAHRPADRDRRHDRLCQPGGVRRRTRLGAVAPGSGFVSAAARDSALAGRAAPGGYLLEKGLGGSGSGTQPLLNGWRTAIAIANRPEERESASETAFRRSHPASRHRHLGSLR